MTKNPRPYTAALDACDKGVPGYARGIELQDVAAQRWNVLREDLPLPVAVLKQAALMHNSRWMRNFIEAGNVSFAPHGKTTMSPDLFDLQLADGAWAITVSTPHQIQVARQFGHQRIFLANQLVGRSAIEYVVAEMRADSEFQIWCLVDSVDNVDQLARAVRDAGNTRTLAVLVEMGYEGGRTGCRSATEGMRVARAVAANPDTLALCGIEGFEGLLRGSTPAESVAAVEAFLDTVSGFARLCEAEGLLSVTPIILSAGGSTYFDLVVKKFTSAGLSRATRIVLRSGCYLTHDSLMYAVAFDRIRERSAQVAAMGTGLRPAIEVWAYVQSRPEERLAIVALGKRDVSYDEPPLPIAWYRPAGSLQRPFPMPDSHHVTRLNDQHCYLRIPADSPLRVGDMIGFGISHPCLTFDKWRVLHKVDADYNVVGSLRTYF
jgi:D-serine dehydratase